MSVGVVRSYEQQSVEDRPYRDVGRNPRVGLAEQTFLETFAELGVLSDSCDSCGTCNNCGSGDCNSCCSSDDD